MFPAPSDAAWIDALPEDRLARLLQQLFAYEITETGHHEPGSFSRDLLATPCTT